MKILKLYILFLFFVTNLYSHNNPSSTEFSGFTKIMFTPNLGQYHLSDCSPANDILYVAELPEGKLYVRNTGLSFVITKSLSNTDEKHQPDKYLDKSTPPQKIDIAVCRTDMNFIGSNAIPVVKPIDQSEEYINYYIGKTELTDVHPCKKVLIENVYDNIDFEVYINDSNHVEYDFIVKTGANPDKIAFNFENYNDLNINKEGNIILKNNLGTIEQIQPFSYQKYDENKQIVNSRFKLNELGTISFDVQSYDRTKPLRIDPVTRIWVNAIGGNQHTYSRDMALDNKGGIFVTGETWATNIIADRFQTFYQGGNSDGYLIKYDYSGQRVWSAYVGGEGEDYCLGMSLDTDNNIILAGGTWSKEFPADTFIKNVITGSLSGFIIKLDSTAKKKWATYIHYQDGDRANDVITDKYNNVIVTGFTYSSKFVNTYDDNKPEQEEMFLMKFDKDCRLLWSRLFGGNANDVGIALAIDSTNHIYVTGESKSLKLPNCKNSPNDTIYPDIFYAKFDKDGNNIWTNRVIGNNWDFATKIQIDSKNNVIVAGHTYSLDIKTNGVQNISNNKDGIVIKCDSTGKEIWSTYVGSMTFDYLNGLCIDRFDNIYCTGGFASTLNSGLQPIEAWNSQYDIILGKIKPDGMFDWFTYFGGWGFDIGFCVNVDQRDNIFVFSQIQSYDYKYDFGYPGGYTRTFISLLKYNYPISIPYKLHPFCIDKADSVQFLLNKKYNEKIHFFAELSDSTGKFDKPVVIGDVYADTSAFIPIQNTNNIKSGDKYRLRITSSDTNLIHVYPENVIISNPPSAVISSASDTVCQGLVSIFEADYFKDCLYEWIPTGGKVISTDSNNCSIRWDSTGIQKLTLIVRNTKSYCESSIQKSIFVLNKPEIKSKSGIELCASDSSFVLDIADTKGGTYSGNHVKGNKFYTDSAGIGSHKVQYSVTDQNGCTNSIEINIIINPVPDKPVIIRTGNYLIATHSIGYQWFYNGNKMLGDTNSEVLANTNGKYTVIVYNEFGCPSVMSDPYDFINSVSDQSQNEIEIYPQPVENILCITNSTDISNPIIISNLIGEQLIRLDNQQTPITQIDVSMLPSGLYFIRQGTILKKFVKL